MNKTIEMLQNHLKVIRAAQGAAIKIVTDASTTTTAPSGKLIPPNRGPEYWDAVNELKDLTKREEVLVGKLDQLIDLDDPDLAVEANEKLVFNERGELIIE